MIADTIRKDRITPRVREVGGGFSVGGVGGVGRMGRGEGARRGAVTDDLGWWKPSG
jgi:hypothetical protein